MLIERGTLHDYRTDPASRHWELLFAHFHPRPEWAPHLLWPTVAPGVRMLDAHGEALESVEGALWAASRFSTSTREQAELLASNQLEGALLWYDNCNSRVRRMDERIRGVLDVIEADPAVHLTVAQLARTAGLSVSRFAHLFRQETGSTPLRYLEGLRLDHAARLLELTDKPVSTVARDVGYEDALYFGARFRRRFGDGPRRHRQKALELRQMTAP